MRLATVYARFFRSLNYDYLRASDSDYEADPWDLTTHGAFPFVRIKIRPEITTVVGANESGKSQVLRAVEAALRGEGYERSDFCRYSRFFGGKTSLVLPEFGAEFDGLPESAHAVVAAVDPSIGAAPIDRLAIFRTNEAPMLRLYIQQGPTWSQAITLQSIEQLAALGLPAPFRIDADIPLPDSVPIQYLVSGEAVAGVGRAALKAMWDAFAGHDAWFANDSSVQANAGNIVKAVQASRRAAPEDLARYRLAADLLFKVAGVTKALLAELQQAVQTKNGYAQSIVDEINTEMAKSLNFPHWWSQDSQFELFVSLFEYDLVFMIRDRTGRTYGFDERSDGLKYFLSYFVQYLAHEPRSDGRPEVLLMDEPDRFLSSSGQQDLLRIFSDFVDPQDPGRKPVQVVYVTHSPFLVDKNEADRVRVLEKGEYDEGTRVVNNASANHYEPLRSAFGSFVAETTFIGNCNLMVEGASDQVLIAGTSRWLRTLGVAGRDRLDLNDITIVPAGGTRHIPYLVYLARGRDVEKPPVIVLLDNDKAGQEARDELAAGGAYGDQLLDDRFVLQLGQGALGDLESANPLGIAGIEDIIALPVALAAAQIYCREFVPDLDVTALSLSAADIFPATVAEGDRNRGLLTYLQKTICARTGRSEFHLDKIAFSRAVISVLSARERPAGVGTDDIAVMRHNFGLLLSHLALVQRQAERAESADKISTRINRTKREFVRTRQGRARKEDVLNLAEEIGSQLDNSPESEEVRATMRRWRRDFDLEDDPRGLVADYPAVIKAVESLAYQAVRAVEISDTSRAALSPDSAQISA